MFTQPKPSSRSFLAGMAILGATLLLAASPLLAAVGTIPAGFAERFAEVNGVRLHYLIGGKGSPVVLLHGYAQTGHMWRPLMQPLAKRHTVIVPDLRGAGGSSKPESGYDKKNMAVDIHELTTLLGFERVSIVGHDIGLMVAYAYAAQFPQATERVILMDAFLPGIGNWKDVWLMRDLWHFHFYGKVHWHWSRVASAPTSSTSGTISPPIRNNLCLRQTAASMPRPMPDPAECVPVSSTFATSSRTRRILSSSPRPSYPCRCWS